MYVTYFDEVKPDLSHGQEAYWVGGIAVPKDAIATVEARLAQLAKDVFGSTELTPSTEFHCKLLYAKKGQFKGMPVQERIDLLVELVGIIKEHEAIKRVMAAINPSQLFSPQKAAEIAFAFFCERVQMLLKGIGQTTILIGDHDNDQVKAMIREFATYRDSRTMWDYGIKIENIVDTVHFAQSHHSRMIQLADVYMFYLTHMSKPHCRKGWMADRLRERLKGMGLYPHKYKIWPPAKAVSA